MTAVAVYQPRNKHMVTEDVWLRVTHHLSLSSLLADQVYFDPKLLSERVFDQTLAFLHCCGVKPLNSPPYGATTFIDEGWHSFQLHLEEYIDWCNQNFGRIIYHRPHHPTLDYNPTESLVRARERALQAMKDSGFYVDTTVWELGSGSDCDDACSYAYLS